MKTRTGIPEGNKSWRKLKFLSFIVLLSLMLPWTASTAKSQVPPPPSNLALEQIKIIEAEADSYVVNDDINYYQNDANFGKMSTLQIGRHNTSWQMAYIRFYIDLRDLPPSAVITSAWAQLNYIRAGGKLSTAHLTYGLASNDWDEYQITFNDRPPCLDNIYQGPVPFDTYPLNIWINVFDFVDFAPEWQKNGETLVSLCVGMEDDNFTALFSSRETGEPPHIIISYYEPVTDTPSPFEPTIFLATIPPEDTPFPIIPIAPNDSGGGGGVTIPWWLIGAITIPAAFLAYLFLRPRKPPSTPENPPPKEPPKKPFIPPVLPPLRLLRFWLTQDSAGGEQVVSDATALASGSRYNLNVQIQVRTPEHIGAGQAGTGTLPLDLVLYSPESDFLLERRRMILEIPGTGSSVKISVPIEAKKAGLRRVRLCLYYQNTLLQSAVLEAEVVSGPAAGGANGIKARITRQLDYVASPFLTGLGQSPRPAMNIFTNETSEGTHWVGVYSSEPDAGETLRNGQLFVFEADHLAHLAQMERQSLAEIQGGRRYHLEYPLPLDDGSLAKLEQNLVSLALEGFKLYNDLFLNDPSGLGLATLKKFDAVLHTPGIISVARCRGSSTSLPWAALYSFPLDVDQPAQLRLCDAFKQELKANQWNGQTVLNPIRDHLDSPQACLGRPDCPLRAPGSRQIVCPFGFWGLMHQIEQPLQQIKPTSVDSIPETLQARNYTQDGVLLWKSQQKLRCAVGVNQAFANDDKVCAQIQSIVPSQNLEIDYSTDSSHILALIKDGGRHFYYFFCHGVVEGSNFKLDFSPGTISSASLYPFDINWPDQPKPLFILNGCETTAITPELIHGFLEKLHLLGASGVVGTEIPVVVELAVPFGSLLMYFMLTGNSIGEAFLRLRGHLLRQGNPLGLVYTYYAPADLHLHQEGNCAWCTAHRIRAN